MNCKQGDLAVIVHSLGQNNLGKIVQCIRVHPAYPEGWIVEPTVYFPDGRPFLGVKDIALRPIRDQDGEDETLSWKAVPKQPETV